jgi:hypothetical protein
MEVFTSLFSLIDAGRVHSSSMTNNNFTNVPTESYNLVTQWGTKGSGEGQFSGLNDVIVTTDSSIFLPDYENHQVIDRTSSQ